MFVVILLITVQCNMHLGPQQHPCKHLSETHALNKKRGLLMQVPGAHEKCLAEPAYRLHQHHTVNCMCDCLRVRAVVAGAITSCE
jgi:hypothetical protein